MGRAVPLRGLGRVEVAAYGIADAEHLVEKELLRIWPHATVRILDVSRSDAPAIVEHLSVAFRLTVTLATEADEPAAANREALRTARERLAGSRYERVELEVVGGGS